MAPFRHGDSAIVRKYSISRASLLFGIESLDHEGLKPVTFEHISKRLFHKLPKLLFQYTPTNKNHAPL